MSEAPTDNPSPDAPAQDAPAEETPKVEIDWKAEARKWENNAKANKDAAKKLAAIEEANKSESQRAADRIAKAEAEVASVPARVADALREHLVELHKIPGEDAELFLTAADPGLLLKQVTRLLANGQSRESERKRAGNFVPREGLAPPNATDDDALARQILLGG